MLAMTKTLEKESHEVWHGYMRWLQLQQSLFRNLNCHDHPAPVLISNSNTPCHWAITSMKRSSLGFWSMFWFPQNVLWFQSDGMEQRLTSYNQLWTLVIQVALSSKTLALLTALVSFFTPAAGGGCSEKVLDDTSLDKLNPFQLQGGRKITPLSAPMKVTRFRNLKLQGLGVCLKNHVSWVLQKKSHKACIRWEVKY